jgi:colanic acid biosynthesis glycosyl transferase WcaI
MLVVITEVFPPRSESSGQHLFDLVNYIRNKKNVTVLTSGDRDKVYPGICVKRIVNNIFNKDNIIRRILGQFTLTIYSLLFVMKNFNKIDNLLITTNPMTSGFIVILMKLLKPTCITSSFIMDLNPEESVAIKMFPRYHPLVLSLKVLNKITYSYCDIIAVNDKYMLKNILKYNYTIYNKLIIVPPWPQESLGFYKQESILKYKNLFSKRKNKYLIMYSGNISTVNPIDPIFKILDSSIIDQIKLVIIGNGNNLNTILKLQRKYGADKIEHFNHFNLNQIGNTLRAADCHLVSIGHNMPGCVHPCKIYATMAVGKPVIAFAPKKSHINEIITKSKCGYVFDNTKIIKIEELESALSDLMKDNNNLIGQKGLLYLNKHYDRVEIIEHYANKILR